MSSSPRISSEQGAAISGAVRALRHSYGIEVPPYQLKVLGPVLEKLGGEGGADAALDRLLQHDRSAWDVVIDAITIPETYFFRHAQHFSQLNELAKERFRRGRMCRVLCAGCSSGEEVWSAAAVLADASRGREHLGSVVGWDVNARRLIEASEGRYRDWSVRTGLHGYERFVRRVDEHYHVCPSLRPRARFEIVNLMAKLPDTGAGFDVIFFRNVAIYFEPSTAREIFERLSELLEEDGIIFVGPSDPVTLPQHDWEHVIADGVRSYRRIRPPRERRHDLGKLAKERRSSIPPVSPMPRPLRVRNSPLEKLRRRTLAKASPPKVSRSAEKQGDPRLCEVAALADTGAYEAALRVLSEMGLSSAEAFKWEGVLRLNLEDPRAAVKSLRKSVYLEPNNVAYRRWLAVAFEAAGMEREADRERRNAREMGAV